MGETHLFAQQQATEATVDNPGKTGQGQNSASETLPSVFVRTRTPKPPGADTEDVACLSQLESALRVAGTFQTQCPELLPTSDSSNEISVASFLQADDDTAASLCDAPSLPGGVKRVKFLADFSEREKDRRRL